MGIKQTVSTASSIRMDVVSDETDNTQLKTATGKHMYQTSKRGRQFQQPLSHLFRYIRASHHKISSMKNSRFRIPCGVDHPSSKNKVRLREHISITENKVLDWEGR